MKCIPGLLDLFAQHSDGVVIAHILKGDAVDLQEHIAGLNLTVESNSTASHDGAHVDAPIPSPIGLTHNGDAKVIHCIHLQCHCDYV